MLIETGSSAVIIFDLDDTLYKEIDFLKSGYRRIAEWIVSCDFGDPYQEMLAIYREGGNAFKEIVRKKRYPFTIDHLLTIYREHIPDIEVGPEVKLFLNEIKEAGCKAGLITDGRSITQRNKLKALGLETYFDDVIISEEFGSEKPSPENFLYFQNKYPNSRFFFFGDNTKKDFIVPKKLGWKIFCLKDNGLNIHSQNMAGLEDGEIFSSFDEIKLQAIDDCSRGPV